MEIDVVMDGDTTLSRAHDIAQLLQDKIEVLPSVERAFVHIDHEATHTPVSLNSMWEEGSRNSRIVVLGTSEGEHTGTISKRDVCI